MRSTTINRISKLLVLTVLITFCFCFFAVAPASADETTDGAANDNTSEVTDETGTDTEEGSTDETTDEVKPTITTTAQPLGDGTYAIFVSGDKDADLTAIRIYRKVDGGEPEAVGVPYKYGSVVAGGYIGDKDIKYGSTYQYWAVAYNISEDNEVVDTIYSDMIKVKGTQAKKTYFTKTVATGTTKVKLYWKKIAGAEGYKIYKKEGSKYVLTKTVKGQNKSSVTIKGLTKNKKAYFKIATYSGKITSGKSASVWEKPRDNAYTESPSTKVKNYKANSLSIALKKVSYNKKDQLQFKALLVNRNNRRVSSFSRITIKIYLKGELIGKQTFREKKVDLKKGKTKTMTFTLNKGTKKKGANLRVADGEVVVKTTYGYRLG